MRYRPFIEALEDRWLPSGGLPSLFSATGNFVVSGVAGTHTGSQAVASFTTSDAGAPAGISAGISWGDGSFSHAMIVAGSVAGSFLVTGDHVYKAQGGYPLSVTIHHNGTDTPVSSEAHILDAPVVGRGNIKVLGTENAPFSHQVVATFTDPGGAENLSHYSADIDWGDGFTTSGAVSFDPETRLFSVRGSHNYPEEGTYTLHVTVHDSDSPDATITSFAVIADPSPIPTGGLVFSATENAAAPNQVVATFIDPAGPEELSAYHARIDWGDGMKSDGEISLNGDLFTVRGGHTYTGDGTYTITVVINHKPAPVVFALSQAIVDDPPVSAHGGSPLATTEGTLLQNQLLATFTDPAGPEAIENYSATIDWGDHNQSEGQITLSDGVFGVRGSHTYVQAGAFTIRVTIHHGSATNSSVTDAANISDAALSHATGTQIITSEESQFDGVVATFRDDNPFATRTDFAATIIWGDGHTSAGTVVRNSDGTFQVSGTNVYLNDGSFIGQVTIVDLHGGAQIGTSFSANITAIAPTLTLSGDPVSQAGSDFVLHLRVTEHGSDRPTSFTVDWDDGEETGADLQTYSAADLNQIQIDAHTIEYLIPHRYTNAPNFFSITASFTDEDGTHAAAAAEQLTVLVPGLGDIVEGTFTLGNQGTHLTLVGTMWATYNFPASAASGDFVKVFLGRYRGNPEGSDLPEGSPLAYADVHLQFHVAGQPGGRVTLHFFLPDGLDPRTVVPQFFDDEWRLVVPHSVKTGIDSLGHNFIEITLSADTAPTPVRLTQTVFTIAVVTPAPATTTVIIPPLVSAAATNVESDFRTTATFVPASQLTLSLSASPERSISSSGGGDNKQSESGGDDPYLEPLQWLLGGDEPDDWLFPGEKKAPVRAPKAKTTGAAPGKPPEQQSLTPAPRSELPTLSEISSTYAADIEIGESWLIDGSDVPPVSERNLFFEQEIDSQSSNDVALQSGLALAVVLVQYDRERERKKNSSLLMTI